MVEAVTLENIEHLAIGSAFLGTGGGGDPYLGSLLCREALAEYGPVKLADPAELTHSDSVFVAAAMGAPTVMLEKLFSLEDQDHAVRSLEQRLGCQASVITSAEIGGCNSMMPVAYAAMRGLPLLDGDGMGRAFPQLQMTSFNIAGVAVAPMTLADEHGNVVTFEAENGKKAEEFARPVVAVMGAAGCLSCYPMTGAQARTACVRYTISAAIEIGQAIAGATYGDLPPIERLLRALDDHQYYDTPTEVFSGKITAVERTTKDGWVTGECHVETIAGGSSAVVAFQNENLSVHVDGTLRAVVPDLVTIVDSETAHAIPTERLAYGQRVSVIACEAPPALTTPEALAIVGPDQFGLSEQYSPLGKLHEDGS
ncbi:DUF917 domain-containing protein [Citromicrobium bathyomarinum]